MTSLPLKWHGGKHYLAPKILELFPPRASYTHFVEPFFGGGAVLFAHDPKGKSEVVNDLDGELTNFWMQLQGLDSFQSLKRLCEATPFSDAEFSRATLEFDEWPSIRGAGCDRIVRAWHFFVRYRQSRQGLGKDFATLSRNRTRRGMNEQASSWLSAIEGLPEAHARLKRVVILNDDAIRVIQQQDGENTLFYCDPPYLHETRTATDCYAHEMSKDDHIGLLDVLGNIKGRFLLSGYPHPIYEYAERAYRWNRTEIQIDNKASSAKVKEIKTECVWHNF